jgi:hypothetical protein
VRNPSKNSHILPPRSVSITGTWNPNIRNHELSLRTKICDFLTIWDVWVVDKSPWWSQVFFFFQCDKNSRIFTDNVTEQWEFKYIHDLDKLISKFTDIQGNQGGVGTLNHKLGLKMCIVLFSKHTYYHREFPTLDPRTPFSPKSTHLNKVYNIRNTVESCGSPFTSFIWWWSSHYLWKLGENVQGPHSRSSRNFANTEIYIELRAERQLGHYYLNRQYWAICNVM